MSAPTRRPFDPVRTSVGRMWGFHIHQDLTPETESHLPAALAKQQAAVNFVRRHGIECDVIASFKPGYGPHLNYAWEVRVESSPPETLLHKYGAGLLWIALNKGCAVGGYVHPTMHDESLPGLQQLAQEAIHHRYHAVVFGAPVRLKVDFFTHPPLTTSGAIEDTRSVNQLTEAEVEMIRDQVPPFEDVDPLDPSVASRIAIEITVTLPEQQPEEESRAMAHYLVEYIKSHCGDSTARLIVAQQQTGRSLRLSIANDDSDADGLPSSVPAAFGAAMAWLFSNRLSDPVNPPFDQPPVMQVEGRVLLRGADPVAFKLGLD